ncbi:unnamed protein product [Aureobasidium pullulans]|nr:unnamed protein product [Aureobasidium pullulans]
MFSFLNNSNNSQQPELTQAGTVPSAPIDPSQRIRNCYNNSPSIFIHFTTTLRLNRSMIAESATKDSPDFTHCCVIKGYPQFVQPQYIPRFSQPPYGRAARSVDVAEDVAMTPTVDVSFAELQLVTPQPSRVSNSELATSHLRDDDADRLFLDSRYIAPQAHAKLTLPSSVALRIAINNDDAEDLALTPDMDVSFEDLRAVTPQRTGPSTNKSAPLKLVTKSIEVAETRDVVMTNRLPRVIVRFSAPSPVDHRATPARKNGKAPAAKNTPSNRQAPYQSYSDKSIPKKRHKHSTIFPPTPLHLLHRRHHEDPKPTPTPSTKPKLFKCDALHCDRAFVNINQLCNHIQRLHPQDSDELVTLMKPQIPPKKQLRQQKLLQQQQAKKARRIQQSSIMPQIYYCPSIACANSPPTFINLLCHENVFYSSTKAKIRESCPPGESGSNIHVKQRVEFTYLEIKKMYSCPAKCGTESNDKSHMLRHIWVDHREEDGLNLMKQFQIDSGAEEYPERLANEVLEEINAKNLTQKQKTTQSNLLRKQRLDFAGPEKIAQAKLKHEQAAQHEQYSTSTLVLIRSSYSPRPSSATPLAKNYTLSRCWMQRVFSKSRRPRGPPQYSSSHRSTIFAKIVCDCS